MIQENLRQAPAVEPLPPRLSGRVRVDGKQFSVDGRRFRFRGVSYGTFAAREDGTPYPDHDQVVKDFDAMARAGFTVVRTYVPAPPDIVDAAGDAGLRLFPGYYYDWPQLLSCSRRDLRRSRRDAVADVRAAVRRLRGSDAVLAFSVGNEVPSEVLRWSDARRVTDLLRELADTVREEDPSQLVTYANYPSAEYLQLDFLDFLTFNVFLERPADFRRYLNRLQNLAGDRPLVLGEMGLDTGDTPSGERRQEGLVDWQMETALQRGVAGTCLFSWTDEWVVAGEEVHEWHFGLTRRDRSERPALAAAARWNEMEVRDLDHDWPSISVVVCAYNAAATLDECLRHACALDYPALEVVVVDDGSTDATADIARRHPRARLVQIDHAGLSVARNEGFRAATGEIVAYLDSDAYPSPEWPYYLALGFEDPSVGGVGGPNVPPPDAPLGAQRVARAPGGPVHVLVSDDRAEHIPGCNMAFRKDVLAEVGGCDPVYQSAGDDVDLCWRILDRGWEIGFHPAALVWHHRRPGVRTYLRQQRGYGRAEALVEARHPDRFTPVGTARWHGQIYDSFAPALGRNRIYHGLYGLAPYQSVYRGGGHGLDLAHQVGVPAASALALTAPLALLHGALGVPALLSALLLIVLFAVDVARARPPRDLTTGTAAFRAGVALLHLAQPLVRTWGRMRHGKVARLGLPSAPPPLGPAGFDGDVIYLPAVRDRAEIVADVVAEIRRGGIRVLQATGWEDHDGTIVASTLVAGDLVSVTDKGGCVRLRVRRRLRRRPAAVLGLAVALSATVTPVAAVLGGLVVAVEAGRGVWRSGPAIRAILSRSRPA